MVNHLLCICLLQLNADAYEEEGKLAQIRRDRQYDYEDEVTCSREKLSDYDTMVNKYGDSSEVAIGTAENKFP